MGGVLFLRYIEMLSPYSIGVRKVIESLSQQYNAVLGLDPFRMDDLEPGRLYGLCQFNALLPDNPLDSNQRQNTRNTFEDRALSFDFLLSSTAPNGIAAQAKAIALLLQIDHAIPFLKYFVAGEQSGVYDLQPSGEARVVAGQSQKPPYTWYLDATCEAIAPIAILKDLGGAHKASPQLTDETPSPPLPPITSSPYIEPMTQVILSANQKFAEVFNLSPYQKYDLKVGNLYGLIWVRSLRPETGKRIARKRWEKVAFGLELELHAATSTYREAQMLAGELAMDLDHVIPYIKPFVDGSSTIYDFQPIGDISTNITAQLKEPHGYVVVVSCKGTLPAAIFKDNVGAHGE